VLTLVTALLTAAMLDWLRGVEPASAQAQGGFITTVAGRGLGSVDYTTFDIEEDSPAIQTSVFQSTGVVVDATGDLYFSEPGRFRVRRIDARTGLVTTVAGSHSPGFSGDGVTTDSVSKTFRLIMPLL